MVVSRPGHYVLIGTVIVVQWAAREGLAGLLFPLLEEPWLACWLAPVFRASEGALCAAFGAHSGAAPVESGVTGWPWCWRLVDCVLVSAPHWPSLWSYGGVGGSSGTSMIVYV